MTSIKTTLQRPDKPDLETNVPTTAVTIRPALPRWAPWGALAASVVVVSGLLSMIGFSVALFLLVTVAVFAALLFTWSSTIEGSRKATDRLVTIAVGSAFLLALVPLISVVVTVLVNGLERFDLQFFAFSMQGVVGAGGGVYHAITGTLIVTGLAALMSIPVGLLTAIYLVEYGRGRLAKAITFFVDVMTGIPSIVAGLFAYALFALFFGPGVRMGIVGAVALTVLMIPVVVRSTDEVLKIVPNDLREAAYALGVPRWRTIVKVVLPTAIAGIASGVTLAIARVIGETAPLLITLGITTGTNLNPFDGRMASLPVFSYYEYVTPGVPRDPYIDRAWTAALVLIIIVMALSLTARLIARLFAPRARS
ncbi:MAG: phosphate ABC transporter permease PstA [Actinomycetota bacterium]|nr:phosphate ABC transporter permease PstA [Actinomycetota bacterium]